MTISVNDQLFQLAAGLIAGGGLGLLLDIFRMLRRHSPRLLVIVWDLLYLLISAAWVFALGQGTGAGMRIFFLCACGLGWALYLWGLSELTAAGLAQVERLGEMASEKMRIITKLPRKYVNNVGIFLKKHLCKK